MACVALMMASEAGHLWVFALHGV